MATITASDYERLVRQTGLVKKNHLAEIIQRLTDKLAKEPDSQILAKCLIKANLLTAWQHSLIVKGYTKGFFVGKYKLLDHIGTGGMSEVYLAEHTLMRRQVALKVLNQELTENTSYRARFYRESQATAILDHPNIVRTYDVDCEGKLLYMVMEYMEGPSLEEVAQNGALHYLKAAEYIRQAALGLNHAHDAGLIHRDIKPGNLMLTPGEVVKLLDFGMVRLRKEELTSITIKFNESMLGTADYLSPEQALDSHDVDSRTDVYSLGCTLYFLLMGRPPFNEGSMALRLMKHQTEEPPSIAAEHPEVPDELIQIVRKMMAKTAEERYQTAAEIADALENLLMNSGEEGKSVLSVKKRGRRDEDTADGGSHPTLVESSGNTYMIDESADSQMKITCASCSASVWVPVNLVSDEILCPRCSSPLAMGNPKENDESASQVYATWKYPEYEKALLDKSSDLIPAVRLLCKKFPGNDKVSQLVGRLILTLAQKECQPVNGQAGSSQAEGGEATKNGAPFKVDRKILKQLIESLGAQQNTIATQMLQRVILGQVFRGPSDPVAAESSIETLAKEATQDREIFLANLLVGADAARPEGRGRYTASELRVKVATAFMNNDLSDSLRADLKKKQEMRSLSHEVKNLLERILDE